jgi:hypothetical protein
MVRWLKKMMKQVIAGVEKGIELNEKKSANIELFVCGH